MAPSSSANSNIGVVVASPEIDVANVQHEAAVTPAADTQSSSQETLAVENPLTSRVVGRRSSFRDVPAYLSNTTYKEVVKFEENNPFNFYRPPQQHLARRAIVHPTITVPPRAVNPSLAGTRQPIFPTTGVTRRATQDSNPIRFDRFVFPQNIPAMAENKMLWNQAVLGSHADVTNNFSGMTQPTDADMLRGVFGTGIQSRMNQNEHSPPNLAPQPPQFGQPQMYNQTFVNLNQQQPQPTLSYTAQLPSSSSSTIRSSQQSSPEQQQYRHGKAPALANNVPYQIPHITLAPKNYILISAMKLIFGIDYVPETPTSADPSPHKKAAKRPKLTGNTKKSGEASKSRRTSLQIREPSNPSPGSDGQNSFQPARIQQQFGYPPVPRPYTQPHMNNGVTPQSAEILLPNTNVSPTIPRRVPNAANDLPGARLNMPVDSHMQNLNEISDTLPDGGINSGGSSSD